MPENCLFWQQRSPFGISSATLTITEPLRLEDDIHSICPVQSRVSLPRFAPHQVQQFFEYLQRWKLNLSGQPVSVFNLPNNKKLFLHSNNFMFSSLRPLSSHRATLRKTELQPHIFIHAAEIPLRLLSSRLNSHSSVGFFFDRFCKFLIICISQSSAWPFSGSVAAPSQMQDSTFISVEFHSLPL